MYLLDQPGVDINFKDDKGRTVILTMLAEINQEKPLTADMFDEISDMVNRRGADLTIVDNDGKNGLHWLCGFNPRPQFEAIPQDQTAEAKKQLKEWNEQKKLQVKFIDFFLSKGCCPMQVDTSNNFPITSVISCTGSDKFGKKNYDLLNKMVDAMETKIHVIFYCNI